MVGEDDAIASYFLAKNRHTPCPPMLVALSPPTLTVHCTYSQVDVGIVMVLRKRGRWQKYLI